ncbi:hypothetical protein DYB25_014315 [Aphanomyces astaci]|uniref:AGC-kinase C-terminal domain-containing protein n=3 Tax=Aphanomyces astaci TaxID=112090 RepID=A0A397AKD7_APHAT|nr:hypothetical protein DYB25_014315 [Aphanomyces astaci]RHY38148.1 hypothetical protein DYB38_006312 [Aphanomyces astaci]RHY47543.1 hypothetical protein DYB30_013899 [Aphanomyces astaci]
MIDGRTPFNAKTNQLIKDKILTFEVPFSDRFSKHSKAFVQGLLQKKPENRLGCGPDGVEEIKRHPWFASTDWAVVEARRATFSADQAILMQSYAKEYATVDVFDTYMHANEIACDTPTSMRGSAAPNGNDLFQDFDYNHLLTRLSTSSSSEEEDASRLASNDAKFDIHLLRPATDPKEQVEGREIDEEGSMRHSSSTVVATSSEDDVHSPAHLTVVHNVSVTTTPRQVNPADCNVTML